MIRHRRKGHENTGHTNEHISSTSSNNQSAVMTRKNHRAQLRRLYEDSKFSDLIVRTLVDDGFLRNELEQFSRTGDLTRGTTTTNDVIVQVNHANVEKEAWNERRRLLNLEPIVIAIDKEDGTRESSYDEDMQQPSTSSSLTFTTSQVCPDQLNPDSFQDDFNLDPKDYGTQEDAKVISRIGELRRQGLWSSTRLPMCIEPAREKTHWDYLLEEVKWMSIDFKQERIFKRVAAKKMTQGIARWAKQVKTKEKEKVERSEKEAKQICGLIAKMVKEFWKNVDKIADFRAQEIIESKKRKALDQHLSFIVGEADKLSSMMQEGLTGVPRDEDATFDESEEDDESTLAKEEKITQPANIEQEIKELNQEADLDLDTFLATLPAGYLESLGLSSIKDTKEITEVSTPVTEQLSTQSIAATSQEESLLETPPGSIEPQITPEEAMDITASEKPCLANVDYSKLNSENSEVRQRELDHIAEEALKFQPKGYTLDSTQVKTEVPFLLRGVLREYQLVGLDWLATLYEKNLNGILADEMGLGKTIQTIALLAHLACEKAIWGPHLIVVPTSVILNWEMEFKKWCPSFKILTYFGSAKERAEKRKGWSRENSFHVCITSYKVITQDIRSFKMKAWQYFILDEAQNIKNFKSQRWQALLNIRSRRRILLTGTPLQNSLMELWSLMHFLMPIIFASHDDFKDWFSNPLTGMIEGSVEFNSDLVQRLHKVLRPFILRRLKSEVEKQLPTKTEKIIKCPLSRRQRYLYDDFLSRRTTIENLKSGSVMSVLNIVMQLRKCCNHPNLFETRPVVSPFVINPLQISFPNAIVEYERKPLISMLPQMLGSRCADILMSRISLDELLQKYANITPALRIPKVDGFKFHTTKEVTERARKMNEMPKITDMEVDNVPESGQNGRLHGPLQFKDHSNGRKFLSLKTNQVQEPKSGGVVIKLESTSNAPINEDVHILTQHVTGRSKHIQVANSMKTKVQLFKQNNIPTDIPSTSSGLAVSTSALNENNFSDELSPLEKKFKLDEFPESIASKSISEKKALRRKNFISMVQRFAHLRRIFPLFLLSEELFSAISKIYKKLPTDLPHDHHTPLTGVEKIQAKIASHLNDLIENAVRRFVLYVSKIFVNAPELFLKGNSALFYHKLHEENEIAERIFSGRNPLVEEIRVSQSLQFPEARLIEYDCGKLQMLSRLLKQLHEHKHRCLIFTQMSKMLDILQSFLAYHNYQYFRLDGATPIEQRQAMMERFNADSRIFCFILSTRSGGLGINLIGADSVIFYDSDWNPTWDQQAQDRCHRIGQTRDVVIYRLISEKTIEENILKKAMQKKRLGEMAIDEAGFTPEFFKQSSNIRDLFEGDENVSKIISSTTFEADSKDIEMAMANVEDKQDVIAASRVTAEARAELAEFDENAMSSSLKEIENPSAKYLELINRLRPIERYAVNFLENAYRPDLEEEVKEAEAQLMAKRNELIKATEIADDDGKQHAGMDLTYDRGNLEELDVHLPLELLPIWLPPSPPASDEELPFSQLETECYAEPDIYCSTYGDLWYEPFAIPEESLPRAIYELKPRKTPKKGRPPSAASKRLTPLKLNGTGGVRKRRISSLEKPTERQSLETELSTPVPGLLVSEVAGIDSNFGTIPQRITPVDVQQQKASFRETVEMITRRVAKRTGDSILQRSFFDTIRFARPGVTRHLITSPPLLRFEAMDYEGPAWTVFEDHFLFTAVTKELGYSSNLMNKSDGHVLNWDFVANFVNMKASHYRSPRQCFVRFQILNQVHDSNRNLSEVRKRQSSLDRQRYANTKERLNQESPRYLMNTIQKRYKLMGQLAAKRLPVFKRVPNENRLFCLSGRNPPQHERRLNQLGVKLAHITSPSDIRVRTQRNQLSHEDSTKGRTYKSLYTSKVLQQFPPVASSIITMPVEAKQRKSLPNILTHKTNAFVNKRSHPIPHVSETDGLVLDEARLSPIPREMYSAQPKPQPPSTWVSHVPTTTITTPNMPSYRPQIVTSVAPFSSGSPMIRRVQPGISFVNTSSQHMRPVFDAPRSSNTTEIIVHSVHTHNTPVSQQQQQQHQTSYYPNSTVQQQNVQSMPGGGMVQGSAYVAQSQQQQPQQAHSYGNEEEMNSRNWQR